MLIGHINVRIIAVIHPKDPLRNFFMYAKLNFAPFFMKNAQAVSVTSATTKETINSFTACIAYFMPYT